MSEAKAIIKALNGEVEALESRVRFLGKVQEDSDPRPLKIRRQRGQGKGKPAGAFVICASDWHMGERVRPNSRPKTGRLIKRS